MQQNKLHSDMKTIESLQDMQSVFKHTIDQLNVFAKFG